MKKESVTLPLDRDRISTFHVDRSGGYLIVTMELHSCPELCLDGLSVGQSLLPADDSVQTKH